MPASGRAKRRTPTVDRARRRNGLPAPVDRSKPLPRRLLGDWRLWMSLTMVLVFVASFLVNWMFFVPEHTTETGVIQGLGTDVLPRAALLASFSAVPLALVFMWMDRFRPQGLWIWVVAFLWGGLVSTAISAPINTWASAQLSVIGNGDPATSTRGAVFIAPFVEEAAKATIIFWLAILMRHRIVSRLSTIALAGLSGAGFAFVENIVYYGRVYRHVATTSGTGVEADQAMNQLALMRGGMTFFAHPLFAIMTGIGLAVAVRARSRSVRILAPVAGFLAAALLHMLFNFVASSGAQVGLMLWFIAISVVVTMIVLVLNELRLQRAVIAAGLVPYVRAGWLHSSDPAHMTRIRTRARALWEGFWAGPRALLATLRTQRAMTELAYLRDAMQRGLVDATGTVREQELLNEIQELRASGVVEPVGTVEYPWQRWRRRLERFQQRRAAARYERTRAARWSGATAVTSGRPVDATLGSTGTEYSPVDPRWGPPNR